MFNALYCYTNVLQLGLFLFVPIFVSNQSLTQRWSCITMSQLLSKTPWCICRILYFTITNLPSRSISGILWHEDHSESQQPKSCHKRTQAWRSRSNTLITAGTICKLPCFSFGSHCWWQGVELWPLSDRAFYCSYATKWQCVRVMSLEMWPHGSVSWLFKANVNIFYLWKYAKACISWLWPSACLHIRFLNMIWTRTTRKIGANMPNDLELEHSIKDTF